jgi:Protein of unknown function (DUF3662)/FHA domain
MGLQQFEQRLERLVEGAFAKAFRGELQPVELGRRLTREMDLHRSVSVRGFIAPNEFDVALSPLDFERFGGFVEVLARELESAAREHAHSEGYIFLGPVLVRVGKSPSLPKSTFAISASLVGSDLRVVGWIIRADGSRLAVGDDAPVRIGRLADNTIALEDPNVSRHHAELTAAGAEVMLVDLRSTNGTRVNGTSIERQVLTTGDVITIGRSAFRYEAE